VFYKRRSPWCDGLNDIYSGVECADEFGARRLLLGGDGGGSGSGDAGGYLGTDPAVDQPVDVAMAEAAVGMGGAPGTQESITGVAPGNVAVETSFTQDLVNFLTPFDTRSYVTPTLTEQTNYSLNPGAVFGSAIGVPGTGFAYNALGGPNIALGSTTAVPGAEFGTAPSVSLEGIGSLVAPNDVVGNAINAATNVANTASNAIGNASNAIGNAISGLGSPSVSAPSVSAPSVSAPSVDYGNPGGLFGFEADPGYSPYGAVTSFASRGYRNGGAVRGGIGSFFPVR